MDNEEKVHKSHDILHNTIQSVFFWIKLLSKSIIIGDTLTDTYPKYHSSNNGMITMN